MEDRNNGINLKDMCVAPIIQSNNKLYNCSKCQSIIEILSINESKIQFKCKEHDIKMEIKDYLKEMKQYNNIKLNDKLCNEHKNEYYCYCFDCNLHLCINCLDNKIHNYHFKVYLKEIIPDNDILNKIQEKIKENKININKLNEEKIKYKNKISKIKENIINKIMKSNNKIKEINKYKEKEELKLNNYRLKMNIDKLKKEYENKIKMYKIKNEKEMNNIKKNIKLKMELMKIYIIIK